MNEERTSMKMGPLLESYRARAHLTQEELAQACGIKVTRDYIGSVELGRIVWVRMDKFNALHHVLRFPGWEMLEAMGYETDVDRDPTVSPRLMTTIRQLSIDQQDAADAMLRAWIKGSAA